MRVSPGSAAHGGYPTRRKLLQALGTAVLMLVVGAAALAPAVAHGAKKKGDVHEPPYKAGPTGGDQFNFVQADPSSGNMAVFRLFPGVPPIVGCAPEPAAGWAMFRVKHEVKAPVSRVTVAYTAALDPYSWVSVGARDSKGEWLGVAKRQGPHVGEDELTAQLFDKPSRGETITIEFGLQLGDACPQAGQAAATFPSVTVK
jgi:hypothetical protein